MPLNTRAADSYDARQATGLNWLPTIPAHWSARPLKQLVRLRSGGTPSKDNVLLWGGDIPWASSKDLKSERLHDTQDHLASLAVESGLTELVPTGSVLVVVRGMILAHSFPVTQACVPMAINQDLKALTPTRELSADFLAWALRGTAAESLARVDEAGHGTKVLRLDAWLSLVLPVPSRAEQEIISAFLDRETAKIDGLVEEQRRLMELLKEKRQAVISHAVTKGLNPDAHMKPSGIEWLGEVPAHWQVIPIKRLVISIEQGWSPQCDAIPAEGSDEWGVLKVGAVNGGHFNAAENKRLPSDLEPDSSLAIRAGDVLVSRANTRELVGSAAALSNDYPRLLLCDKLYRLRVRDAVLLPQHLSRYLGSAVARSQIELDATGASASMVNIGQSAILDLPIPLPPIEEQAQLLESVTSQMNSLEELMASANSAIALLQERRAALISAAVTGHIDVRHLVPAEAA